MKKGIILFAIISFLLISLFSINFISASFECSDGNSMLEDIDEIKIYNRKSSNGLSLGLIYSDESAPLNRISTKFIIDGYKFTLTDNNPSVKIELKSGKKNITLINLTSNLAGISVDGSSKNLELKEVDQINHNEVFISSMSGSYPGSATVEGIIGKETIELDNKNPPKIVTLDSIDYLLELSSASDFDATIIVKTCENSTTTIIEIVDPIIPDEIQTNETVITNLTINSTTDDSITESNDTTLDSSKQSSNLTNNEKDSISNGLDGVGTKPVEFYFNIFFLGIIIIIFLIIAIFIMKYFKMKEEGE